MASFDRWARFRRDLGARIVDGFFEGTSNAGKLIPLSNPRLHNVEVIRDLPYRDGGQKDHLLDIYRPRDARGPLPVVLYLHGGGFRICSKESHWIFGLVYSRRGYLVVNANYRLAPRHKYPAAHDDAFAVYDWVVKNIHRHGGDPSQLILAGESAGANLCTSLAVATSYPRPEPFARAVYELGVQPKAVVAACGFLQVSDPGRFARPGRLSMFLQDRMDEVSLAYLDDLTPGDHCALADPLCLLEKGAAPPRPLPPFFAFCGTWDPVIADTRRLSAALARLGVRCETRYYPRGLHAFHAFVFDPNARKCWRETFKFLGEHLPAPKPATQLFA